MIIQKTRQSDVCVGCAKRRGFVLQNALRFFSFHYNKQGLLYRLYMA